MRPSVVLEDVKVTWVFWGLRWWSCAGRSGVWGRSNEVGGNAFETRVGVRLRRYRFCFRYRYPGISLLFLKIIKNR